MIRNNIEFDVVINGKTAPLYAHDGDNYIEGRNGSEYCLRIKNLSYDEVLAIPSVDGLSVLDGSPATLKSRGYILKPYETIDIPGWIVSNSTAAKFAFSDVSKSYASKSGDSSNVGVIGLAVYDKKKVYLNLYRDIWNSPIRTASPLVASASSYYNPVTMNSTVVCGSSLGTEFGEATDFKTHETSFERGEIRTIMEIFYDSAQGLMDRGIVLNQYRPKKVKPSAFGNKYCTPPTDWR